jgi:hypothetical protein
MVGIHNASPLKERGINMHTGFEEYLNERQNNQLKGILRCRSITSFTAEEEIAFDLLKHDFFYSFSDSGNTLRTGAINEKRLLDYIHISTAISEEARANMAALFEVSPEQALQWLDLNYGYLNGRHYLEKNPTGIVGAILDGLTIEEYKSFRIVNERLLEIHDALDKAGLFGRILDTTDLPDFGKLRTLAANRFIETKSRYYFGILLPLSIQAMVDDLVRFYKQDLLTLSKKWGDVLFPEFETVKWEHDERIIELRIAVTGDFSKHFGIFLNVNESRPRRNSQPAAYKPKPHVPAVTPAPEPTPVAAAPKPPVGKPRPLAPSKPKPLVTETAAKKPTPKVAPKKREGRVVLGSGFEALKALQA